MYQYVAAELWLPLLIYSMLPLAEHSLSAMQYAASAIAEAYPVSVSDVVQWYSLFIF
jgi:hypothetical protein